MIPVRDATPIILTGPNRTELVDEEGRVWAAARLLGEFVIVATLMGVPAFFWMLLP